MQQVIKQQWQDAKAQLYAVQSQGQNFIRWDGGDLIRMSGHFIKNLASVWMPLNAVGFQFEVGVYRVEVLDYNEDEDMFLCRRVGFAQAVQ